MADVRKPGNESNRTHSVAAQRPNWAGPWRLSKHPNRNPIWVRDFWVPVDRLRWKRQQLIGPYVKETS